MERTLENELTYTKVGDYFYPNIVASPVPDELDELMTKYGHMRLEYLVNEKKSLHSELLEEGKVMEHCLEIQRQAEEMMDSLMEKMAAKDGITEALKSKDPLEWAAQMNRISGQAEEIVLKEIVYS